MASESGEVAGEKLPAAASPEWVPGSGASESSSSAPPVRAPRRSSRTAGARRPAGNGDADTGGGDDSGEDDASVEDSGAFAGCGELDVVLTEDELKEDEFAELVIRVVLELVSDALESIGMLVALADTPKTPWAHLVVRKSESSAPLKVRVQIVDIVETTPSPLQINVKSKPTGRTLMPDRDEEMENFDSEDIDVLVIALVRFLGVRMLACGVVDRRMLVGMYWFGPRQLGELKVLKNSSNDCEEHIYVDVPRPPDYEPTGMMNEGCYLSCVYASQEDLSRPVILPRQSKGGTSDGDGGGSDKQPAVGSA